MANYINVDVVCPCGKLLDNFHRNADCNSVTKGEKNCPACKKKVRYELVREKAYTHYK
ncbi:MAG: hypothetical protein ACRCWG_13045 [Sarcina sp.]